jgi:hypothetical protein
VTVDYATANGTATAGSDYVATAGNLSFPAGTTSRTFSVTVNGDTTNEPSETILVNLSNPAGATLADAQAVGTITNDDGATTPTLTVGSTTATPGGSVSVTATGGPGLPRDWVGVYASTGLDSALLDWKYLNGTRTAPTTGMASATVTFAMPLAPGTYNFRLFTNNTYQKLATSPTVTVQGSTGAPTLTVSTTTATRGQNITVTLQNGPGNLKDWIGLHPTAAADTTFVDWKYLGGLKTLPATPLTAATLTFTMPSTAGTYNFRLFANGSYGKLSTSATVTVQ